MVMSCHLFQTDWPWVSSINFCNSYVQYMTHAVHTMYVSTLLCTLWNICVPTMLFPLSTDTIYNLCFLLCIVINVNMYLKLHVPENLHYRAKTSTHFVPSVKSPVQYKKLSTWESLQWFSKTCSNQMLHQCHKSASRCQVLC